jgi:hypothetical protein
MGEQILTNEQIAENTLKEFLQSELGDYSFNWTIKREPDYDNNNYSFEVVYVNPSKEEHSLRFYYDIKAEYYLKYLSPLYN